MYLEFERCKIYLSRIESSFVAEGLEKIKIKNKKNVKSIVEKLYYNSNKRYFRKHHINEISNNLLKSVTEDLKEEVGRNLTNQNGMLGNNSGTITDQDILHRNDIVSAEVGISGNSDIVTLKIKGKKEKVYYFDSPESANEFIRNIRTKNL